MSSRSHAQPGGEPTAVRVARAGFWAVVVAAVISGGALLVAPGRSGDFFSWGLGPPPLASLVGGLYIASAVTFAVAAFSPWARVGSLLAASVALTVPTLVFTFVHLGVFDFGRWQSWAWLFLFIAAPPFWSTLLVVNRRSALVILSAHRGPWQVVLLALVAVCALSAVILWTDPTVAPPVLPFTPSLLGGRFLGAWMGFLGVMVAWLAVGEHTKEERTLPLVALTSYLAGALVAGIRNYDELAPSAARAGYLLVLAAFTVAFGVALVRLPLARRARDAGT